MAKTGDYIVGIDVGASKVGVLIAQRRGERRLEVVGKGRATNRGTRRGNVVNVEATVQALKSAVEEAEVMAGVEISSAYVGIAGSDIRCLNSRGMVTVSRKNREITREDIGRVLEAAQSTALPTEREILHAIPQEFAVDDQAGIVEPLGMLGSRLEVNVHLVTGQTARSRTLLTCLNRTGIEVAELVFEPLAAAEAVLTHDERELGVVVVDIGAGTTSFGLFAEGEVQHSAVIPIGSNHFTNDLAMVLRTPFDEAERIKTELGCCLTSLIDDDEGVSVPTVAGGSTRVVPKRQLCEILQPRAVELFQLAERELARVGVADVARAGVVLSGGGAQLDGLLELAEQIFNTSVRYGLPHRLGGLVDVINCPTWSTASGLLLYGAAAEERRARTNRRQGMSVKHVVGSLRNMFADLL